MKCVIPGANVKVLARAIHALAKIGEEMYVQPQERALSIRSVGLSNSAYCDFTFQDNYFSYYNYGDLGQEEALKCKISMRGAMGVFKTLPVMDKLVESCHMKLQSNATDLIIILKYKSGVNKTFLLPILNCETIQASYNKDGSPNQLLIQPKVLADAFQNFQPNLIEITLDVCKEKLLMRNYVNDTCGVAKATRTQLALAIGEFDTYRIGQDACVTFCVKEVKAILAFADIVMLPIHIHFEIAGRPIVFMLRNQSFEVNLVLATVNPEPVDASNTSIPDRRPAKRRGAGLKKAAKVTKPRKKAPKNSVISSDTSQAASSVLVPLRNLERNIEPVRRSTALNEESLSALVRSTSIDHAPSAMSSINPFSPASTSSITHLNRTRTHIIAETPSTIASMSPNMRRLSRDSREMFDSPQSSIPAANRNGRPNEDVPDEDVVPTSPPRTTSNMARMVFRRCFEATFDPRMLPGHDRLLAKDSDESD